MKGCIPVTSFPNSCPKPARQAHAGRYVRLSPLQADEDADELYGSGHEPEDARNIWRHLPYGPFANRDAMHAWLRSIQDGSDPLFFTVSCRQTGHRVGMISILRIAPEHGCAELGHIWYGVAAQRTSINTESVLLLLRHLFDDLGYRRVEWKCDAENVRSRAAALRLGFEFEGIFRQHMIVKERNRDTAWFAMLDRGWPRRRAHFERWLASEGKESLSKLNGIAHWD